MTTTWDHDIAVVGAGAAGLMAAIRAAEMGRRVLLLEKNRKVGVKILMSGGTRCNITHDCDNRGIVTAYGTQGKFLHSPLASFGVRDAIEFFHAEGVPTKVEETGKVFPVSDKAIDVQQALLRRLHRAGAILANEEPLLDLVREGDGFRLTSARRTLTAGRVIVTTGGLSFPGCGTTGDGYRWAKAFGHSIVPTRPALVPITVQVPWVTELRGITLPDAGVRIVEGDKALGTKRGSLLFAHFGLSGPVVLDLSRIVSGHAEPASLALELDFAATLREQEVDEHLKRESLASGKKQLASLLPVEVPARVCEAILAQAGLPLDRKAAGLSKPERQRLVTAIKRCRMPVAGTLGYAKAEVTAGGVSLDEVDSRNLRSKLLPNLYLAGEILDLDGPIGGYNFQAAWSTGWLAGQSAATA
jgi:predicted Rossmann fold flavoprotein